ncbi:outer membrane beta-barrel protein [Planctomycetes bacterium Pla133]|uniref:outer membrane beta-barrel protein n=1 Tax=Engelhardtia mirabilis TaxID=2528011 RepID=UPI0011A9B055
MQRVAVEPAPSSPEPSYATLNVYAADRQLDQVAEGLEDIAQFDIVGAEGIVLPWPQVPLGFEFGASYGSSATSLAIGPGFAPLDVELTLIGVSAGLRLYLYRAGPGGFPLEPFIAAGVTKVYANVDVAGLGFADAPTGNYLRAGLQLRLTRWLHVGIDYRRLAGASSTVQLDGGNAATVDFDNDQVGLFVGVRF